MMSKVQIAV
jgi:hypothetical protein